MHHATILVKDEAGLGRPTGLCIMHTDLIVYKHAAATWSHEQHEGDRFSKIYTHEVV